MNCLVKFGLIMS